MNSFTQSVLSFFEQQSFGVCTYLANKFRLSLSRVRLFFIYPSCLSVGAPFILYFFAFLALDIRKFIRSKRRPGVFEN